MSAQPLAIADPSLRLDVRLGMPHLTPAGLSETWLFKACGHQHWLALAEHLGLPRPDFRAVDGARLYATFTVVRLTDGHLDLAREHADLTIETRIGRVSRTQFRSRHVLHLGGAGIGVVEMMSVFVRRTEAGVNRSVERAVPRGRPCLIRPAGADDLAALAQDFRKGRWGSAYGLRRESAADGRTYVIAPCPHTDFNGADFLYFASFQAFVDRAEWSWFGLPAAKAHSRRRDIFYYGNVELGEAVRLTLKSMRDSPDGCVHWVEIANDATGRRIADAITVRSGFEALPGAAEAR